MDTEVVLDTIPDKESAAFLAHPEETADKVQQHVSSDSIPTGPEVTSKMRLEGNIPSFDKKGQQAVTKLFGHLQDAQERLTPEEITEENCCNLILPRPFHPKFSTIAFKHPTRCLAAAAHFLIRKKLFNTKYPQLLIARFCSS